MQLELDPKSRYMTTFYTHCGLRRFKRLNFGTNSAAELFHQEISQTLVDITNPDNIMMILLFMGEVKESMTLLWRRLYKDFRIVN